MENRFEWDNGVGFGAGIEAEKFEGGSFVEERCVGTAVFFDVPREAITLAFFLLELEKRYDSPVRVGGIGRSEQL